MNGKEFQNEYNLAQEGDDDDLQPIHAKIADGKTRRAERNKQGKVRVAAPPPVAQVADWDPNLDGGSDYQSSSNKSDAVADAAVDNLDVDSNRDLADAVSLLAEQAAPAGAAAEGSSAGC
jgi:hypothetical protein